MYPLFISYPRPLSFIPPGFAVPLWERGRRADAVGLSPLFSYPRLRRTPLKKGMGGLTRLVSYFGWGGWRGWAFALDAIVVCSDPPPRPPLFRGVGGMSLALDAIVVCSDPLPRPPLFRGVGGMSLPLNTIVVYSDPLPRPPLFRGVGGMSHSLVAIAVCSDPLLRPPLFRGVGGMSHSLAFVHTPFYFHTPGPFQKGRAGAVLVFH